MGKTLGLLKMSESKIKKKEMVVMGLIFLKFIVFFSILDILSVDS